MFLSESKIALWINYNKRRLANNAKGRISAYEYLFLVSNAAERIHKVMALPTSRMTLSKDEIARTFQLEEGLEHSRAPDAWLQLNDDSTKG